MILAINTAQNTRELAIFDNIFNCVFETSWIDEKNDVEKLAPSIKNAFALLKKDLTEIKKILIVNGPGSFTGLRVGVSFANVLAMALKAEMYCIGTMELLNLKASSNKQIIVLHQAGIDEFAVQSFYNKNIHENDKNMTVKSNEIMLMKMNELLEKISQEFSPNDFEIVPNVSKENEALLKDFLQKKSFYLYDEKSLLSLGCAVQKNKLFAFEKVDQADAIYLKKPIITQTKNPWKKV